MNQKENFYVECVYNIQGRSNMRQYRGLRLDGKGWVYGWYSELRICSEFVNNICVITDSENNEHEVDPKTVGQEIGLQDKYEVDIYEGDKIGVKFDDGTWNDNFVVEYDEQYARFKLIDYTDILDGEAFFTFYDIENETRKIGTIHTKGGEEPNKPRGDAR